MQPIPIKINMTIGRLDGQSMSLEILVNGSNRYSWNHFEKDKISIEFIIDPGSSIELVTSNKGPFDTRVDENGNILEDKFIKIDRVWIANMPVDKWILEKCFFKCLNRDGTTMGSTNYFGYNGNFSVKIGPNPFRFFLHTLANSS